MNELMNFKVVDEVKIRTRFLRGIIGKIVEKIVRDKLGKQIEFSLKDLDVEIGEKAEVHLEVSVKMSKEELWDLVKEKIGL